MHGSVVFLFLGLLEEALFQGIQKKCSDPGYKIVTGKFGEESHLLCLKTKLIDSLKTPQSALILDPDAEIDKNSTEMLEDVRMAHGFPLEDPAAGSAEGYIGDDHHFYGVLHLRGRTLHADPYGTDKLSRSFGAFENDHVAAPRKRRHTKMDGTFPYLQYVLEDKEFIPGIARSKICDLLLLADMAFFENDANSSLRQAVKRMVHAVGQADVVFRNADFDEDGAPDNIGFSIKYVLVLTSNETNTRVFGDLLKDRSIDGKIYLMRFARLRRLSEVCLGVAFSGHAFHNKTLGLSFTSLGGGLRGAAGGLCDRRAFGRSYNTLVLAHATNDDPERVPERIAALTLTHELGHSFGAHHDDSYPKKECKGFLMSARSSMDDDGKRFEFSVCSKRLISSTLNSLSYCLREVDKAYCGNGIVEDGEACDCGLPIRCSSSDPCCTPRAGGALLYEDSTSSYVEGCSVAPAEKCHPSQGRCCTETCDYADLSDSGINCTSYNLKCNCQQSESHCRCGLGGRCLLDDSCHAAECALLGLRECQCTKPVSGVFAAAQMCGVCCKFSDICQDIEWVVRTMMKTTNLPEDYPDLDYHGPNVTLGVCNDIECRELSLRAWKTGGPCVSLNQVGTCSSEGICTLSRFNPKSNQFPKIMKRVVAATLKSGSSERLKITFNLIFFAAMYTVICILIIYQK